MNVAFLTYHSPPDRAVGAIRAVNVARAFRDAGHKVTVITSLPPGETGGREEVADIEIVRVAPWRNVREVYAEWKTRRPQAVFSESKASKSEKWRAPTRVAAWKRFLFSLIWLPDDRQGFVPPAVQALRRLDPVPDVILSSGPPFSCHLAAFIGRKVIRRPWIMEFRDPWSGNPQKQWWIQTGPTEAMNRWLERMCLRNAELVVSVSEGIDRHLRQVVPTLPARKFLVVRNGISSLQAPGTSASSPGTCFNLVHLGTINFDRDPGPVLQAIRSMVQSMKLRPGQLRLRFIGDTESTDTLEGIDRLGIGDYVEISGWVPYARAQEIMLEADALLLLARNQPAQIPNKLYDYLGARKPILALADQDGETAQMLRAVGGHHVFEDAEGAQRALEFLMTRRGQTPGSESAEQLLQGWTTAAQMRLYIQAAMEVANGVG